MRIFQFLLIMAFTTTIMLGCGEKKDNDVNLSEKETVNTESQVPAEEINTPAKSKAPEFSLTSIDGKEINLSDYKGKIVLVDFWATWCGPCRRGIPDLVEIQNQYKDKVVVLGISLDRFSGTDDQVKGFMKQYSINYPILFGDEKVIADYGNIQNIPTSFVIDQEGNVVDMHVGLVPKSAYEDQIKALMGES